ncbi:hypothetical protein [Mucilaginibacter sp.]|uniref:hypothetical protein n=1 Tax=Mucilaginibacter sp. TaxID=1882438 RepID=UPI0025EF7BAF|nr:hypothetical protein [Mucilaginibacter sp.]
MTFSAIEIEKIRAELPRGSLKKLAAQLGLSEKSIGRALKSESKNDDVIIAAAEMVASHKDKVKSAKDTIAAL